MLRRQLFARSLVSAMLLFALYVGACQYTFENFLHTLKITFDDFPIEYAKALNDSVAQNEQPTEFDYPSTFPEVKIPRTIHFIWFKDLYPSRKGVTEIPSIGSLAPERCLLFNPTYEIRMWNTTSAREFLEDEYKWFLPTYDGYRYPIQRIDALKYFVLYHYGGVYMDLDIACRRSLDPLLGFPAWFPEASPLGVNNDLMASAPRHPVFKRLTESLISHNRNWIFPYVTIFWTTGPHFTSVVLQEWYNDCGGRKCAVHTNRQDSEFDTFALLPQIFYSEEYTFFGHSQGGTWHGKDVAVVLWFVDHSWMSIIILVALVGTGSCVRCRVFRQKELANYQLV